MATHNALPDGTAPQRALDHMQTPPTDKSGTVVTLFKGTVTRALIFWGDAPNPPRGHTGVEEEMMHSGMMQADQHINC